MRPCLLAALAGAHVVAQNLQVDACAGRSADEACRFAGALNAIVSGRCAAVGPENRTVLACLRDARLGSTVVLAADPLCERGLLNSHAEVCCSAACDVCDEERPGAAPLPDDCSVDAVRRTGPACALSPPPCVTSHAPAPQPAAPAGGGGGGAARPLGFAAAPPPATPAVEPDAADHPAVIIGASVAACLLCCCCCGLGARWLHGGGPVASARAAESPDAAGDAAPTRAKRRGGLDRPGKRPAVRPAVAAIALPAGEDPAAIRPRLDPDEAPQNAAARPRRRRSAAREGGEGGAVEALALPAPPPRPPEDAEAHAATAECTAEARVCAWPVEDADGQLRAWPMEDADGQLRAWPLEDADGQLRAWPPEDDDGQLRARPPEDADTHVHSWPPEDADAHAHAWPQEDADAHAAPAERAWTHGEDADAYTRAWPQEDADAHAAPAERTWTHGEDADAYAHAWPLEDAHAHAAAAASSERAWTHGEDAWAQAAVSAASRSISGLRLPVGDDAAPASERSLGRPASARSARPLRPPLAPPAPVVLDVGSPSSESPPQPARWHSKWDAMETELSCALGEGDSPLGALPPARGFSCDSISPISRV